MKKQLLLLLLPVLLFTGCATTSVAVLDSSQTMTTIETEHNKVHQGLASRFWGTFSVPGGSVRTLHIDIDENNLHFKERNLVIAENDGEVFYKMYVDCDVSDNGVIIDNIHNSNTLLPNVDNTNIYLDPTVVTCGDQTDSILIPVGSKGGSVTFDNFEWIYKSNTSLIVEIQNLGVKPIDVNLRYKWYVD